MMRRALLVFAALALAAPAARAQSIVAGPVATQVTAGLGERITIPVAVNLTGAPGIALGSYAARLAWNPVLMRLVSATPGTFAAPAVNADSAAQGVVRFAAASSQGVSGVPVLVNITFEVINLASADTFRLSIPEMDAAGTFQDLLPFLSVTNGSFCGGAVYGDLNRDGVIQALDAQIALMYAVGMDVQPPPDTLAGDVDADGTVTTRDALIILSDVIQLDVSAFRIGTLISGICETGDPTLLNVVPTPVTLAVGDTFRVSAQVRDSAGNLAPGVQLVWSSNDPSVATVDSLGVVRAIADGSITLTASVSPMLSGQGTVTVGPRHRWRVDPANAQGPLTEIGSDTYPFSTIAAAVAHAAPGDTISVAVGRYGEPLQSPIALVFDGDSGASGVPVISTPNRPAGQLAGVGRHVVRRFRIEESQAGLDISGDTVDVTGLRLTAIRGPGLRIRGPARATLRGVSVDGVRDIGVAVDSAGVVQLAQVAVSGVDAQMDSVASAGIFIRADSAFLDTVSVVGVAGVGIITRDAAHVRARRARVEHTIGGFHADSSGTVSLLDSTVIRRIEPGDGLRADFDTLRISGAVFEDIEGVAVTEGGAWLGYDSIAVIDTRIERAGHGINMSWSGVAATLQRLVIRDVDGYGVFLPATRMRVDSSLIERTGGHGLYNTLGQQFMIDGSTFRDIGGIGIIQNFGTGRAVITGTRVERTGDAGIIIVNDTLELLGDTLVDIQGIGVEHTYAAWLNVRDVLMSRTRYHGVYTYSVARVEVARSRVDTSGVTAGGYAALYTQYSDTVRVDSSAFHGHHDHALAIYNTTHVEVRHDTLDGNFRHGSVMGGTVFGNGAVTLGTVQSATIRHNLFWNNRGNAMRLSVGAGDHMLRVDSNTVRGAWAGIYFSGYDTASTRIEVVDNDFTGRMDGAPTHQVYASYLGTLLVSGNTFDSIAGAGITHTRGDTLDVAGNAFTDQADDAIATRVIYGDRVAAALVDQNTITCSGASVTTGIGMYRTSAAVTGNTVTGCGRGVEADSDVLASDTVSINGNTVAGAGVTIGGIVVRRGMVAALADNVVSDGAFTEGGLAGLGTRFLHVPSLTTTGDSVLGGAGRGVVLHWVDTADVGGAVVAAMGSLYADTTSEAALWLRNVFGPVFVHGGSFTAHADAGILLTDTTAMVTLDTNLVADNLGSGVVLRSVATVGGVPDTVRGAFNSVRRNAPYGLRIVAIDAVFAENNFEGNGVGVFSVDTDPVDVTSSWWGAVTGPACDTALGCAFVVEGDSLVAPAFLYTPFATDTVLGTPIGAPPAIALRGARFVLRPRMLPPYPEPVLPGRAEPMVPAPPPRRDPPRPGGDR